MIHLIRLLSIFCICNFFKNKLAYRKETIVNWDPVEQTVLANEQVIDGKGWRSGAKVERKLLNQWFLNITKFSDDLLSDLDVLDKWPENVKIMQKNWIGKSIGADIQFNIINNEKERGDGFIYIDIHVKEMDII